MKQVVLLFVFLVFAATAMAQKTNAIDLSVFPNPVTEFFIVQDAAETVAQVAVFNLVGKKMKEFQNQKDARHVVSDLSKGIYLVQLLDKDKNILKTVKIDKR